MYISFYSFVILFFSYVIIVVREVYPLDNCQFVGIHRLERIFICKLIVQYLFEKFEAQVRNSVPIILIFSHSTTKVSMNTQQYNRNVSYKISICHRAIDMLKSTVQFLMSRIEVIIFL